MWIFREKKTRMISPEVDKSEFIAKKSARKKQIDISAPPQEQPGYADIKQPPRPSVRQLAPQNAPASSEIDTQTPAPPRSGRQTAQPQTPPQPIPPRPGTRPVKQSDRQPVQPVVSSMPPDEHPSPSRMQAQEQPANPDDSRRNLTSSTTEGSPRRIGDMLIKYKLINQQQLDEALAYQKSLPEHKLLGQVLIELGFITEMQLTISIAKLCQIPFLQITKYNVNSEAIGKLSGHICRRLQVLPLDILGKILTIAMVNPFDYAAIREAEFHTNMKVKRIICLLKELEECFELFYPETEPQALPEPEKIEEEAPREEDVPEVEAEISEQAEDADKAPPVGITSDLDNIFAEAEERVRTSLIERKSVESRTSDHMPPAADISVDRETLITNPSKPGIPLSERESWEIFRKSPMYIYDKKMESFLSASVLKASHIDGEVFELVSEVIK